MSNLNYESIVCPGEDVTAFEITAAAVPMGMVGAYSVAESNPDILWRGGPVATLAGVGSLYAARWAVNQKIDPDSLERIPEAENNADKLNSKFTAVAAGIAGVLGKYELTKFFDSGNIKEAIAGAGLSLATYFLAKDSLYKYRASAARDSHYLEGTTEAVD